MKKRWFGLSVFAAVGASALVACDGARQSDFKFVSAGDSLDRTARSLPEQSGAQVRDLDALRTEQRRSDELLRATLKGLQDQIDALKKKDEELAAQIGDVRTSLSERIAAVEARLEILENDARLKSDQIRILEGRMSAAEANIVSLQGDVAEIRRDLVQNYATRIELSALQRTQVLIQRNLSLLNSELYGEGDFENLLAMSADPEGLKSRIDQIDADLQKALNDIQANGNTISAHSALISTYQSQFDELKERIVPQVNDLVSRVGAGETDIERINDHLVSLGIELGEANERIANTSKNLGSFFAAATNGGVYNEAATEQMQRDIAAYFSHTRAFEADTLAKLAELGGAVGRAQNAAEAAIHLAGQTKVDLESQLGVLAGRVTGLESTVEALGLEVKNRLNVVEQQVNEMLVGLTPEAFAKQFSDTVAEVATLKTNLNSLAGGLDARIESHVDSKITDFQKRLEKVEVVQSVTNSQVPAAAGFLRDYSVESTRLTSAVVETISPAGGGALASGLSGSFQRTVGSAEVCSEFRIEGADFGNVFGTDYFVLLARYYTKAFVYGWRPVFALGFREGSGPRSDIFHNMPGFAGEENELLRLTLNPLFEVVLPRIEEVGFALGAAGEEREKILEQRQLSAARCLGVVREWTHSMLFSSDPSAVALQAALSRSDTVRVLVETLNTIGNQAAEPLAVVSRTLSQEFPAVISELQAEVARHTQNLLEIEERVDLAERRMESEFATASAYAAATRELSASDDVLRARVDNLEANYDSVKKAVDDVANQLELFMGQQAGVNSQLFGMIAALATELNLDDIAHQARQNVFPIHGVDGNLPEPTGNEPGLGIHIAGLSYANCSSLAGTKGFMAKGWLAQQHFWAGDTCAVNFRKVPSSDIPKVLTLGGFRLRVGVTGVQNLEVQTQLFTGWKSSDQLVAGSGRSGTFNLKNADSGGVTVVGGSWIVGVFDLDVAGMVADSLTGSTNRRVRFTLKGFGPGNVQVGSTVSLDMGFYSPLILNFAGTHTVATSEPMNSGVRFDLDADGVPELTGWLARGSSAGFLALDLNQNGKIDDGSELFGEATEVSAGKRAENGYIALSGLDKNQDGRVDSKDPGFDKLKVWFDRNLNGQTDAGELVSIREAGVTAVSTKYSEVADVGKRAQSIFDNDHKYEARFWGPDNCGIEGCASFDIYFSKASELTMK